MNDVWEALPAPSLELGILASFLTSLNFLFYPSPSEIMLANPPPPAFFSSPPLPLPIFLRLYVFFGEICKLPFLNDYLYCRGWGVRGGG